MADEHSRHDAADAPHTSGAAMNAAAASAAPPAKPSPPADDDDTAIDIGECGDDIDSLYEDEDAAAPLAAESRSDFFIVGIGASAGGLKALESFFKHMKADSGIAFVLVQHLSPDYKSMMVELLSKYTEMTVCHIKDGMPVQPSRVYLIPPKTNLTIYRGTLYLTARVDEPNVANLPIDLFFRSLAVDLQEKAIGIILSGTGSDGTLGARAIKESGGLVIAQDPASAQFDGMPNSIINNGLADYILPPEEMPERLMEYIKSPAGARQAPDFRHSKEAYVLGKTLGILRQQSGLDFTYYKPTTILRRIQRRMAINHIESVDHYVDFLAANKNESSTLYQDLLIGVTHFFRDAKAFDALRDDIIPKILETHPDDSGQPVRVWCAGCSTGEEVYSLAILFADRIERMGLRTDVKIFGTDVDRRSIETASKGVYPGNVAADIPQEYLSKYFYKQKNSYHVMDRIRKMAIFTQHNLFKDPPFNKLDLITCRNLLIYLKPSIQRNILSMFAYALKKGRYLLLGGSETIGDLQSYFEPVNAKWKIFQYRGGTPPINLMGFNVSKLEQSRGALAKPQRGSHGGGQPSDSDIESIIQSLIKTYLPPIVIVDEEFCIRHVMGDVSDFLRLSPGKFSTSILSHMPKNMGIVVSNAVTQARKENRRVVYKDIPCGQGSVGAFSVDIAVDPFSATGGPPWHFAVSFVKRSEPEPGASESFDIDSGVYQRIHDLESELQLTRENLQATIEELETSNEELQATNEELMASNEELQSTNEELQSVNEELYTVNSEYQNKIEELTVANADIYNFLNSTKTSFVFLDKELKIRRFTPSVVDILPIIKHDIGRPIQHLSLSIDGVDILSDISKALKRGESNHHTVRISGKTYQIAILPYLATNDAIAGVIINLVEIING